MKRASWTSAGLVAVSVAAGLGCNAVLGLDESTLLLPDGSVGADSGENSGDDTATGTSDDGSPEHPASPDGSTGEPPGPSDASVVVAPDGALVECTSGCSAGLACERYEGPTCLAPLFAQWPMPNPPSDVDAGAPNREKYTDNGDGTVTDDVTGLMWQKAAPTGTYAQSKAALYCTELPLAGHSDWRLPAEIELISLIDYDHANPSLDPVVFAGEPPYSYWSSTPSVNTPTFGWGVTFAYGSTGTNALASPNYVRCVR